MTQRCSDGLLAKLGGILTTMLTNGTFDTNTTGWTASSANLLSVASGQSGNALEVANSSAAPGAAYQDITTVIGRLYQLNVYTKKGTAVSGSIRIGTTGDDDSIYDSGALTDTGWTLRRVWFLATATTTRITFRCDSSTSGETALFDEATLHEVLNGFKDVMEGCKIAIYTGAQPATANLAATGTLLATLSNNGGAGGLSFGESVAGVSTVSTATVRGTVVGAGTQTAGWFRCYEDGDDPAQASTTKARFDGSIGVSGSGADAQFSSTSLTNGATFTATALTFTIPTNA